MPNSIYKSSQPLDERSVRRKNITKRSRLTITLLILIMIFICVLVFTFFISSNDNREINTTGLTDDSESVDATIIPTKLIFPTSQKTIDEITVEKFENFINFVDDRMNYKITVRKDTAINFNNFSGLQLGLEFSNGLDLKLKPGEQKRLQFLETGNITFSDILYNGPEAGRIKGLIVVVE